MGDDFHVFTLTWTDQRITLGVDGANYATSNGNFKDLSSSLKIPHQGNWKRGNTMAPFDREFYVSLGVAAGGISDFPDNSTTGEEKIVKPWENTSPKAELRFWSSRDTWHPTWESQRAGLIVDYVKVWSVWEKIRINTWTLKRTIRDFFSILDYDINALLNWFIDKLYFDLKSVRDQFEWFRQHIDRHIDIGLRDTHRRLDAKDL